jgi:hypothetical protein
MKILIHAVILSLISSTGLYAQNIQFGAEAGLNLSGATLKDPGASPKASPSPGFQIGTFAGYALPNPHLSLGARLLFSYEGYDPNLYGTNVSIHVSFIKIPVNLIYKAHEGSARWFFGIGPYIAPALGGHYFAQGNKTTIHFGNDPLNDELKRIDIGANLMAGYQVDEKILLRASFDFGIINYVTPGSTGDNASAHTLNLGITAGYIIGVK